MVEFNAHINPLVIKGEGWEGEIKFKMSTTAIYGVVGGIVAVVAMICFLKVFSKRFIKEEM